MQNNFAGGVVSLRKSVISFIFMLALGISCMMCANASEYDTLKVGLYYGSTAQSTVTISSDSGISYGYYDGTSHIEVGQLAIPELTFRAISANQVIINETQVFESLNGNVSVVPLTGHIKINGKKYRGSALLTNISEGSMYILNLVSTEEYLYGVVPNEVPSSWDEDALKAQAVCARGFVVSNFNKHSSYGFNVCATTNCQVYGGMANECASTNKAVDDTYGEVVMYEGKPIESLFFSSSGGHTANVKNVWGSSISYLSGVEDPYEPENSPRHSWSATLSLLEIENALKTSNINVGTVKNLNAKSDETGRVYELTITGTNGTHTLTRTSTNSPFVSYGVISQKFSVIPVTDGGRELYALTGTKKSKLSGYNAVDGNKKVTAVADEFYIQNAYGPQKYTGGTLSGYTFNGGGWGHGVGMSQYGAMGMANAGFVYEEILAHYYPGTELGTIY